MEFVVIMRLFGLRFQLVLLAGLLFAGKAAAQAKGVECHATRCGNVTIQYPFGLDDGSCFRSDKFRITCDYSTKPPTPMLWGSNSNMSVTNINLDGQLEAFNYAAQDCYLSDGRPDNHSSYRSSLRLYDDFTISHNQSKFTVIGCDSYAYIRGYRDNKSYSAGCMSLCDGPQNVVSDSCSGSGCCQIEIPDGLQNISLRAYSFNNHINVTDFNRCTYAFVVNATKFKFSEDYLQALPDNKFQVVLEWVISNETCQQAKENMSNYACQRNSECYEPEKMTGYRCKCPEGYKGNAYLSNSDGCQDINECEDANNCTHTCINTIGSYICTCPRWFHGNGTKDGDGCTPDYLLIIKVAVGIGTSFIVLVVCASWLYLIFKKRKLMQLKEKFFRRNGGYILKQQLSSTGEGSSDRIKVFTAEELEKATDKYDESSIIGQGGFGTVYKGTLMDGKVVAIKKSKMVDQSQIEQFINEVVVLSQINHRNVVKLLGCCLETEVPLLVYEFVNNGTLFDHIHNEGGASSIPWEVRLRIAAETAGVMSYLHSSASTPIIHRDVKSTNILLDDGYVAKVSDFGASRLVPMDHTQLTTMVQGTLGYLDPEYMHTSQLTEKSDVYSFGVVLVELLTGQKALTFDRPEKDRNLAIYFLSSLKGNILDDILDSNILKEENVDQLKEVAMLASRCLKLRGDERPTMKEVAMELEGLRLTEKHPWVHTGLNLEETEYLLNETPSDSYSYGGFSGNNTGGYDTMRDQVKLSINDGR